MTADRNSQHGPTEMTPLSLEYLAYLDVMGIPVWQRRHIKTAEPLPTTKYMVQPEPEPEPEPEPKHRSVPSVNKPPSPSDQPPHPLDPDDERRQHIARLDWDNLAEMVRGCTACQLHCQRTQAVFGVGNRQARWMIIGEAPGADEDRLGEPFVGRSGKLLDLMLKALHLDREQVFIANIVKCRPPNNRDPSGDESRQCRPFLERQIELVQPDILLAVGRVAAQNLLQTTIAVGKLRNQIHHFGTENIPLVVTYHPAYLLRSPREKVKVWDDLQRANQALRKATTP